MWVKFCDDDDDDAADDGGDVDDNNDDVYVQLFELDKMEIKEDM